MENENFKLPENAHRELKPGEEYEPILSKDKKYQEVTVWSVVTGLLMTILFSAAAAYLGLKVGQVFEAAIPIAIIAIGLSGLAKKTTHFRKTSSFNPSAAARAAWWLAPSSRFRPFTFCKARAMPSKSISGRCSSARCWAAFWASCSSFLSANISSRNNTANSRSLKPRLQRRS